MNQIESKFSKITNLVSPPVKDKLYGDNNLYCSGKKEFGINYNISDIRKFLGGKKKNNEKKSHHPGNGERGRKLENYQAINITV